MKQAFPFQISIPPNLPFSDLALRHHDGAIQLNWAPIEIICQASYLDLGFFKDGPEENVAALITQWYMEHLQNGGASDAVMEYYLEEIRNEEAALLN